MAEPKQKAQPANDASQRKGFVALPFRVLFDKALSPVDLRVLATIAAHDWGERGAGCTLSYKRIGELSVSSESSVKRSLKTLEALRYIHPPAGQGIGGRRYATVIRVTNRARETGVDRPELVPTPSSNVPRQQTLDGSTLNPSADSAMAIDGSSLNGSARKAARLDPSTEAPKAPQGVHADPSDGSNLSSITNGVKHIQQQTAVAPRTFRPDLERTPLQPDDVQRLRQLDAFACPDSEDWLALLLGALAKRERALGRVPDEKRLRAAFDGAIAKRAVARAESPLGFLLAGIERGFLLANPKDIKEKGSTLDPSPFYALPIEDRAQLVVAVARGRQHHAPTDVVRVVQKLLAASPGLAGRVEDGERGELER